MSARTPAALCHAVDDLCRTLHAVVDHDQLQSITHDAYALLEGDPSVVEGLQDAVGELAIELDRIKKRNKELMLLIERKRIQSFRDRQRKRVVIEAVEPDAEQE